MFRLMSFLVLILLLVAPTMAQEVTSITVVTHDSFSVSEEVLAMFEDETGIQIEILRSGDAGVMLNQSILSRANPLGDVMFGVDNTFLTRALENDLFIPYESPMLEHVPEQFILDDEYRVTPIDYGDVCINYDIAYFQEQGLPVPETLSDLTEPAYEEMLVVLNPATSSPGLAFLLVTIANFGTEGDYTYLEYWRELVDNEVLVTDGWSDAYFGHFTAGSEDGTYPLVVSYASSPPATYDAETDAVATGSIIEDNTCYRQIEFAGILAGTEKVEAAQQFIDFMLDVPFQEDMPLQMFVFPVNENAELPELFAAYATIPEEPVMLTPEEIEANREDWIQSWTETVLR